jgi:hypothetical protein
MRGGFSPVSRPQLSKVCHRELQFPHRQEYAEVRLDDLRGEHRHRRVTMLCQQWCQVIGITFPRPTRKWRAIEKLVKHFRKGHGWQRIWSVHLLSHLMRNFGVTEISPLCETSVAFWPENGKISHLMGY